MIYITENISGFMENKRQRAKCSFMETDYLILLGDLDWAKERNLIDQVPCELLLVGELLNAPVQIEKYPVIKWNGAKARVVIEDKVLQLLSGQVFSLEGLKFFTVGEHHDEAPNNKDVMEGLCSLVNCSFEVDVILSKYPTKLIKDIIRGTYMLGKNRLEEYLEYIDRHVTFNLWLCGSVGGTGAVIDYDHVVVHKDIVPLVEYLEKVKQLQIVSFLMEAEFSMGIKIDKKAVYSARYPSGTIIELVEPIEDNYGASIPAGSRFEVSYIDDMLGMHGRWLPPISSSLAVIIEHDRFKIVND